MEVAFVHDWLTTLAGAEKVLEAMVQLFEGPIYTLVKDQKNLSGTIFDPLKIHTSFIQKLPFAKKKYRNYLPFFPMAIEQFDLSGCDVVLSSSHAVAKGVLTHSDQLHICYCHTPMRYAWDLYHQYLKESKLTKGIKGKLAKTFLHYLRMWDISSSSRVDHFVANSKYIAKRIRKVYGRKADVIYPPVDTDFFSLCSTKENYYVTASRMVPYKKIDMIVEAFSQMPDKRLIVVGEGPDLDKIKKKAKENVELLGYRSDEELRSLLQKSQAFVFAAVEDFGILPVEAQACGTPVIAFGKGGARETVIDGVTGVLYQEQTIASLKLAVEKFERSSPFDPSVIRAHAERFHVDRFKEQLQNYVMEKYTLFSSIE